MKFAKTVFSILFASSIAAISTGALAGGSHSGGHSEDTAIGKAGVASKASRTITIEMADTMRYTPSEIQVKKGETIRFIVKNVGKVKHEMSLGTEKELLEHLEQMKKFPDMEHDEPNKITLNAGKQGEIIWQFTKTGTVNFACLMPSHYEAGMKGQVKVGANTAAALITPVSVPGIAYAQNDQTKMDATQTPSMSDGEIRKIDKETGKVTIKHGEIKNLDMPPMTMVFTAKEKNLLDKVQAGDKVKFVASNEGGKMVVTDIQAVK